MKTQFQIGMGLIIAVVSAIAGAALTNSFWNPANRDVDMVCFVVLCIVALAICVENGSTE